MNTAFYLTCFTPHSYNTYWSVCFGSCTMYGKSQVTITQMLDAAQRSFVANNDNAITMTAIAREANITRRGTTDGIAV